MMKLNIKVNNLEKTQTLDGLLESLIYKGLGEFTNIKEVKVEVNNTDDTRVPIKIELRSLLIGGEELSTSAASVNYLSAFSQALSRMERLMQKREPVRA